MLKGNMTWSLNVTAIVPVNLGIQTWIRNSEAHCKLSTTNLLGTVSS